MALAVSVDSCLNLPIEESFWKFDNTVLLVLRLGAAGLGTVNTTAYLLARLQFTPDGLGDVEILPLGFP